MSFLPSVRLALACAAVLLAAGSAAHAQYTTPNITTTAGDATTALGGTVFINHGLQGIGRINGSVLDSFGETFGSVSSMQITNWLGNGSGPYTGTFNILPDRGYNNNNAGGFFSAYEARIQQVNFSFTPYTSASNIGGTDYASKVAAQNQISITSPITGVKLTYNDPIRGISTTTGLDPGATGSTTLFGQTVPYVVNYTGQTFPGSSNATYNGINKLAIDAEGLVLKADGSGYVSDEYGANVYYFNSQKQIIGVITPPAAVQPHNATGGSNFISTTAPTDGRRNNQGLEGLALSPDGKKLFTLLQSGTVQDSGTAQQNRLYTRLAVYDVSGGATPGTPTAEYVLKLPTYTLAGAGGTNDATAAQSEIIAIDDHRLLVLSRDAQGGGSITTNPSVYKSILLVDLSVGTPTNIAGTARDAAGGKVTTAPGVLDPSITTLSWTEAVNMLNSTQLGKFNMNIDSGGASQVSKLTLGEKWEGMSLVPANDPNAPNDYFLFVANDNDFLSSQGLMIGPDGTLEPYNAFTANPYAANRIPTSLNGTSNESDTVFLAYRVTIVPEPTTFVSLLGGLGLLALRRRRRA